MKTKMDRDEETIVTQAEKILLWSAMSKDEVLRKLPCAEMLDKQTPTKRDLVTLEKEASGHEKNTTEISRTSESELGETR